MSGTVWKVVWTLSFVICAVLRGAAQGRGAPTCDPRALDADSYALTTRGVAEVVLEERTSWWDGFIIGKHAEALGDLNFSATTSPSTRSGSTTATCSRTALSRGST